jgi:hypothetical protein
MSNGHPVEVPLGLRQPGSVQFIRQLVTEDPKQDFALELPGVVRVSGDAVAHSLLPIGRVVIDCGPPYREALVTAAVADETVLDREILKLGEAIGTTAPLAFAVRLSAGKHSFGDIVELAEEALGDECCCEGDNGSGSGAQVRGAISVGLAAEAKAKLKWTKPVAAQIRAWVDDEGAYAPLDKGAIVSSWFFNCYGDWEGVFKRRTRCYGTCTGAGICSCDRQATRTPKVFCRGWTFCFCRV